MENAKKFNYEIPNKKDHAGLKAAGIAVKGATLGAFGLIIFRNKEKIHNGFSFVKSFVGK